MGFRQFEVIEQPDPSSAISPYFSGSCGLSLFPCPENPPRSVGILAAGVERPPHAGITHPAVEEDDGFALACCEYRILTRSSRRCRLPRAGREKNAMIAESRDRYFIADVPIGFSPAAARHRTRDTHADEW